MFDLKKKISNFFLKFQILGPKPPKIVSEFWPLEPPLMVSGGGKNHDRAYRPLVTHHELDHP